MSDQHDMSDELQWKRELTALRKAAKVLRDPETTSSLKSPLSTRSVAGASSLNYLSGKRSHSITKNQTTRSSELDYSSPLKCKNSQEQVFLYNWRHTPNKSSDSGGKLEGRRSYENERPKPSTPGDSSSDANKVSSKNYTHLVDPRSKSSDSGAKLEDIVKYGLARAVPSTSGDSSSEENKEESKTDFPLDDPIVLFRVRETNIQTSTEKAVKKFKKSSSASRRFVRKSANSKIVDLPSISSGGPVTSIEQSDDTEYCNSEDLRISTLDLLRKSGYTSKPASPLLSRKGNWSHTSKPLAKVQREDSSFSCTPASTNSYSRYRKKSQNTVESWDDTGTSLNGDEADLLDLSRRQGCGIPCYWSKRTPKDRSCGGFYSPSFSDTLRRKGSSILCGSQTLHKGRSSKGNGRKLVSKSAQGLPLLSRSCDGRVGTSMDSGESDDELSTNFGELDLEAVSRLDGRRWSFSCGSQEGLELVTITGSDQGIAGHLKSLSQKYSPRFFNEIIGQNIVVQSLTNAISRERIAPVYLFQGPRGTGKTTIARIFAAALNCVATDETKPCGSCRECTHFISGKSMDLREVDATNKKGIDRVRCILKSLSAAPPSYFSHYKVFIIDECHLLPTKTWSAFMKFLEEPPAHIVFIFIATDIENLPRTVLSRCQKFIFNKIRDADIVTRLKKLSVTEGLEFEPHALHLIALNADGSLRDAETMLEQLSLLGKKITTSLVNELVGVVPDEKLLDLLELAMSSDTAETVKKSRELMDSGVDPMALMSQLAGLMMDIIAGTDHMVDSKCSGTFFGGRTLSEVEVERLKQALKLLLEAEKQLRFSSERSTWFTAALLQLGSVPSPDPTHSSSSRRSSKTTEEDQSNTSWEVYSRKHKLDAHNVLRKSTSSSSSQASSFDMAPPCSRTVGGTSFTPQNNSLPENKVLLRCINAEKLDDIWDKCIDRCHSKTLRQLLNAHGKLVSISEVEGVLMAFIAFENEDIKSRAERFLSSITDSVETVMRRTVDVRLRLITDYEISTNKVRSGLLVKKELISTNERESEGTYNQSVQKPPLPRKSCNGPESKLTKRREHSGSPLSVGGNHANVKEREQDTPMRRVQAIIDEQRLESAWVQSAEKGTPRSLNRLKADRNQILPQDISHQNELTDIILNGTSSQKWEDELNREIKALKINDSRSHQKEQSRQQFDHYAMSPSLLHNRGSLTNFNKENLGYESGANAGGCGGLLCWKSTKHGKKVKVKPGTPVPVRLHRKKQFSCFGQGRKTKKIEHKFKR